MNHSNDMEISSFGEKKTKRGNVEIVGKKGHVGREMLIAVPPLIHLWDSREP